jgi:hypothetical protein
MDSVVSLKRQRPEDDHVDAGAEKKPRLLNKDTEGTASLLSPDPIPLRPYPISYEFYQNTCKLEGDTF